MTVAEPPIASAFSRSVETRQYCGSGIPRSECRHSVMIELHELAQRHQLDMQTPLLTIPKAMRCTRCGAREGMLLAGAT